MQCAAVRRKTQCHNSRAQKEREHSRCPLLFSTLSSDICTHASRVRNLCITLHVSLDCLPARILSRGTTQPPDKLGGCLGKRRGGEGNEPLPCPLCLMLPCRCCPLLEYLHVPPGSVDGLTGGFTSLNLECHHLAQQARAWHGRIIKSRGLIFVTYLDPSLEFLHEPIFTVLALLHLGLELRLQAIPIEVFEGG